MVTINEALTVDLRLKVDNWNNSLKQSASTAKAFADKVSAGNKKIADTYNTAANKMRSSTNKFVKGADKGFKQVSKAAKATTKTVSELRSGFTQLVVAVGGFAFFKNAVDSARQFDKAMREVITIIPDGTKTFEELSAEVKEVALRLGEDGPKAARAMYQAISAGVDARNAKKFLLEASTLAQAGVTTLETSVDLLTSTLNAYGISVNKASALSDVFFKTVQLGKTTVEELSASIGQVSPIAASAGIKITEVSAAFAALTASGIQTREAATQIKSFISAVVQPSEDAKKAAAEMGLEFDAVSLKAKGLKVFLDDIAKATQGDIELMARLIPNIRGLNFALALTGKGADKFAQSLVGIEKAGGAAAQAAEKVGKGFDFQIAGIETAFKQGMEGIGKSIVQFTFDFEKAGNQTDAVALKIKAAMKRVESAIGFVSVALQKTKQGLTFLADVGVAAFGALRAAVNQNIASIQLLFVNAKQAALELKNFFAEIAFSRLDRDAEEFDRQFREEIRRIGEVRKERERLKQEEKLFRNQFLKSTKSISREFDKGLKQAAKNFNQAQKTINKTWQESIKLGFESNKLFSKADKLTKEIAKSSSKIAQNSQNIGEALQTDDDKFNIAEAIRKVQQRRDTKSIEGEVKSTVESALTKTTRAAARQVGTTFRTTIEEERPFIRRVVKGQWRKIFVDDFRESVSTSMESFRPFFSRVLTRTLQDASTQATKGPASISGVVATRKFFSEQQGIQAFKESERRLRASMFFNPAAGLLPGDLLNRSPLLFNRGGQVPGPDVNRDIVPVRATPGEFIVNREAASAFLPLLQAINRQTAPQAINNNFNFGDINAGAISQPLSDEMIDSKILPRIRFMLRMGRLGG